jgi:hypothetical protein
MRWQTNLDFRELQQYILNEEENVLINVLVLSQECEKQTTSFESFFRDKFTEHTNDLDINFKSIKICIKEEDMPFPILMTPSVYYFKSKNSNYMFVRHGTDVVQNLDKDLKIITKMLNGMSYYDALYDNEKDKKIIKKNEELLNSDNTKSKYPKTSKMLRGFAKDLWESAKYAGKGLPVLVSSEVASERYSICRECPQLTDQYRCIECGCFMRKKVNLAASSCPIGKWEAVV